MTREHNLLQDAIAGKRAALARLLSNVENDSAFAMRLAQDLAPHAGRAHIIGITGPPGAGKSTLINQLLPRALGTHERAAVLAVDPSSPFSRGALLGDRVRMQGPSTGSNVFIRSMASRGDQGGIARATATAVQLFDACDWPVIIIETLGIGQVELDIMNLADTVVVALNPGWGDTFQANKAGLTEAGDLFVINKADRPGADSTRRELLESLSLLARRPLPTIVETVATDGSGVDELWGAICSRFMQLQADGDLATLRQARRMRLANKSIRAELDARAAASLASSAGQRLTERVAAGTMSSEETTRVLLQLLQGDQASAP